MRTRVPLFSAALAALLLPLAAHADAIWGQPSRDWDVVDFQDVNGQKMTLWYNAQVPASLFEIQPSDNGTFQAKRTGYQWKPGDLQPTTGETFAPIALHRSGIVTRQGIDDTDTLGASDYQAEGDEHLPIGSRTFTNFYWFRNPSKTVQFPVDEKLQPTPFRLLKGPVELSAAEKAAAQRGNQAVQSAESCFQPKGSQQSASAAEALANCFSPLELALGDGQTLDNGSGAKISVLPAADDPVIQYYNSGDGRDVRQYIGLQKQSLAAGAAGFIDLLRKASASSPDGFLAGEDRLMIKYAAGLNQTDAFYAELRDDADQGKLADFVKKWRGQLAAELQKYVDGQKTHVRPIAQKRPPVAAAPPKIPAKPGQSAPAATGPEALTEKDLKAIDQL